MNRDKCLAVAVFLFLFTDIGFAQPAANRGRTGAEVSTPAAGQQMREAYKRVKPSGVIVHDGDTQHPNSGLVGEVDDSGMGSGVLISADGKILTAAHVVDDAERVTIEFVGSETVPARVIALSSAADVALLQVDRVPASARPAKLGDSDSMEPGDEVFIIGAPYGLSYTLTVGRISARRPNETRSGILSSSEFLQTDAAINSGNLGSPIFNQAGEVIGIASSILSDSGEFQGVGFAATSNAARDLLLSPESLRSGIEGVLVRGAAARILNLPQAAGFLVTRVNKDSLADRIGLRGGDIEAVIDSERLLLGGDLILEVNGTKVTGERNEYRYLFATFGHSGSHPIVHCKILRGGRVMELSNQMTARKER